jgi:hypothetical protein
LEKTHYGNKRIRRKQRKNINWSLSQRFFTTTKRF